MTDARFLVLVRSDRHPWQMACPAESRLSEAIKLADLSVTEPAAFNRARVIEIGGSDALPTFTLRHSTKRA